MECMLSSNRFDDGRGWIKQLLLRGIGLEGAS